MAAKDRKADRHDPAGPKGIFVRLDRDDDNWLRRHIKSVEMTASEGIKAAVRAYRKQVENETTDTKEQDR